MERDGGFSPLLENPDAEGTEKHLRHKYGLSRHWLRLSVKRLVILIVVVVVTPTLLAFQYFQGRGYQSTDTEDVLSIPHHNDNPSGPASTFTHSKPKLHHSVSTATESRETSTSIEIEVAESTLSETEDDELEPTNTVEESEGEDDEDDGEFIPSSPDSDELESNEPIAEETQNGPPETEMHDGPPEEEEEEEEESHDDLLVEDETYASPPAEETHDGPPNEEFKEDINLDSHLENKTGAPPPQSSAEAAPTADPVPPTNMDQHPPPPPPPPKEPHAPETPESPVTPDKGTTHESPDQPPPPPPPPPPLSPPPAAPGSPGDIPGPPPGDHRLVVIIPMDSPTPELCKVIFSAMANGYPSPIIINWGNDRDRANGGIDKSHLFKIIKGLQYLDKMMGESAHEADKISDNDLVIIVDGLDIWWQLPPDVFIKRYHEANRLANLRLREQWGPGRMPLQQTIIAGSQKRCWPGLDVGVDLHCDDLPESPARPDLFGENTDKGEDLLLKRPKYFNAGTIVGPARDLKRFFRKAQFLMSQVESHHPLLRSDQGIQGEVWGTQEIFRKWLLKQPNRAANDFLDDPVVRHIIDNYEFHVGIDYFQQLWIPTVFKEVDGEFVVLSNQTQIEMASRKLNINPVRLLDIPDDVKKAQHPLKKVLPEDQVAPWRDTPLYADYFSEAIPVIVHHNAHKDGLKERRSWWWDRTWYFPHLRRLVQEYLRRPKELPVLGEVPARDGHAVYRAVPSELTKRHPRRYELEMTEKGLPEMDFDELCRAPPDAPKWFDQVFRDGKGPL